MHLNYLNATTALSSDASTLKGIYIAIIIVIKLLLKCVCD